MASRQYSLFEEEQPAVPGKVNRRKLPWSEKGPCKPKPCKECGKEFVPPSGGNFYCGLECRGAAARRTHRNAVRAQRSKKKGHYRKVKFCWDLAQYGLSLEQFQEMLASQGGVCAICRRPGHGGRAILGRLVVDHCHATGKVRGLLCSNCNAGLGFFKDDTSRMYGAIAYLKRSGADE